MEKAWNSSWSKHTTSSVNHGGAVWWHEHAWLPVALGYWCLVMMWQKTEAVRRILKCIDILSAQIQSNAAKLIGRRFIVQVDNGPKHTAKATQEFLKVKKWIIRQWPSQSPDLNLIEHAFHVLKTKLKAERPTNKQQLKSAAVKAWQSITKEETQSLVMSMSSRLKAVIACKGFSTK